MTKDTTMTEDEIRRALVDHSRLCVTRKLSNATAGNISMRFGSGMLITPSGVDPDIMEPGHIAEVAFDGSFTGPLKPSSEWALHSALYQSRPEAQAIVHAHPTYCVAISCLREPIPSFHYMVASFGGNEVPCAPYAPFGTEALADVVAAMTSNLRMIRRVAEIYGGRSGFFGSWRLTRVVLSHLVATGAVAVGDDMLEPILGGTMLAKLSRRFGEGLVNGALTARVGVAAMEVCRPMPFSEARRPKVRSIIKRALSGLFSKGS